MNWLDPDRPDRRYTQALLQILDEPMQRIKDALLHPKGSSPASIEWNQNRSIQASSVVGQAIQEAKRQLGIWSGKAIGASASEGTAAAGRQIDALQKSGAFAGVSRQSPIQPGFNSPNLDVVRVLAQDTYRDGSIGLDHTGQRVQQLLRKMSSNGLTAEQVNKMMAKSVIEGTPMSLQLELREELEKVNGKTITFPSGKTMTCADYAKTLARTRMREAHVIARHARLRQDGIFYVVIIGNATRYPCTAYLGKIYFIGDGEDPSDHHYPNLDTLHTARGDQAPPFHPNCSKSTAPIVLAATPARELEIGEPDKISEQTAKVGANSTAGQHLADSANVQARAQKRVDAIAEIIRQRARDHGYNPPPWSPGSADVAEARQARHEAQSEYIIDPVVKRHLADLGVKEASIGDLAPQTQKWVDTALAKARDLGFEIPKRITSVEFKDKPNAIAKYSQGVISINSRYDDIDRMAERAKELGSGPTPFWSTTDEHHPLLHEIVHHNHIGMMSLAQYKEVIGNNRIPAAQKDLIASEVGTYASRSKTNFVAEVTPGLKVANKQYSPQIMRWFMEYGGQS